MLDKAKGRWVKKLPRVLWAYRTSKRGSTEETSFSLTYSSEVVIPTEIVLPTLHFELVNSYENKPRLYHNIDLLEERREQALIRLAAYK